MITGQASILACFAFTGGYDDAVITSAALRAINIGFPHQATFFGWSGSSVNGSASACRSTARAVSEAASSGSAVVIRHDEQRVGRALRRYDRAAATMFTLG